MWEAHGHELVVRYLSNLLPSFSSLLLERTTGTLKDPGELLHVLNVYFVWKHAWNILPNMPNSIRQLQPVEFRAGRCLSRLSLGSTSSQKEKHQPLTCQDHSLSYLALASVSEFLNCHCRFSAHTHTHSSLAGPSWRASPSSPRKTILLTAKWYSRCYCYAAMHKIHTLLPSSRP